MAFTRASEEERDRIIKEILSEVPDVNKKVEEEGKRIVVTGKGGVGKTIICAALSHLFADAGFNVLAVDEDPQMNLQFAIGLPLDGTNIVPLNKQLDYIEEKTGARPGSGWGLFFKLNPDVSDVVERFGVKVKDRLSLLVMGTVNQPSVGCACPENDLLQAVINYINLRKGEIILMDTEAGLEHFGRAIAKGFQHAIIVSEPNFNSVYVANQAVKLARGLGIRNLHIVFNKVRNNEKVENLISSFGDELTNLPIYFLPYDEEILKVEPSILPVVKNNDSPFLKAIFTLFKNLLKN
ncbi:MAG: AAA family ATPase [Candidatus Kryptonium sp.]